MCWTELRKNNSGNPGFTLLEILLAVTIMGAVTTITYMTFSTTVTAWNRGMSMVDSIHHGDFVMEQIVTGLRSAYHPEIKGGHPDYGFRHVDDGQDESARDRLSWVKMGSMLVGDDPRFAGGPHRVEVFLDQDERGESSLMVGAMPVLAEIFAEDGSETEPVLLARGVHALDFKMAVSEQGGEIDWLDEWKETNRIPPVVQVRLFMDRSQYGEEPFEIRRIVPIPTAHMTW